MYLIIAFKNISYNFLMLIVIFNILFITQCLLYIYSPTQQSGKNMSNKINSQTFFRMNYYISKFLMPNKII